MIIVLNNMKKVKRSVGKKNLLQYFKDINKNKPKRDKGPKRLA